MKKLLAIALVTLLLVPALVGPAYAGGRGWHGGCCWGGFAAGLGIGVLATAPFWYPRSYAYPVYPYPAYAYPAYGYPAYSYPVYSYPTYPAPTYVPPAGPGASQSTSVTYGTPSSNPPAAQSSAPSAPAGSQSCETVTVEGHNETRTLQTGQSVTAWIPAYTQQVCQSP
jgi:hypothetical protein